MARRCALLILLLGTWSSTRHVHAQDDDLVRFRPALGDSPALTIESPVVRRDARWGLGMAADFAHARLDRRVDCTAPGAALEASCSAAASDGRSTVSKDEISLELAASWSLRGALRVGVGLPLTAADAPADTVGSRGDEARYGVGDARVAVTVPLLRQALPFAFTLCMTLPTATEARWADSRMLSFEPAFALQKALGALTLSGQAGVLLRQRATPLGREQDDAVSMALAASVALPWTLQVVGEARTLVGVGGRELVAEEVPAELDVGVRIDGPWSTHLTVAVGAGGAPLAGSSDASLLRALVAWRASFDGDDCGTAPERVGCVQSQTSDRDHDGLPDAQDRCPHDAEDGDSFADDDGCPDVDNDADGVLDRADVCPNRSEDRDGYQDQDGCSEPDNDADTLRDGVDLCRLDPEDVDGFEDEDGCPEPGPARTTVTVEGARVLLSERIYFEDGADSLRAVSAPVLDELALVLPELLRAKRLRVEGHTDPSGSADFNLDLSYRRARAVVEYLKARGVPAVRLDYVGRGSEQPLAPNDTPEGRALNRRVEFVLVQPQ